NKYIRLLYKYDSQNSRWIRPKRADILKLAESGNPSAGGKSTNTSRQKKQRKEWKKEYKVKGSIRRYRRLIGVDQKK
ncbi:hypothetical protein KA005_23195, partial [bacterium]|nr:hypothetical protein [bacterium]